MRVLLGKNVGGAAGTVVMGLLRNVMGTDELYFLAMGASSFVGNGI